MIKAIVVKSVMVIGLVIALGFIFRNKSYAATSLYLSPASGNYFVGNNFTVGVYISTSQAVNAVEANITYDSTRLTLISCTSGGNGFDTPIPTSTTGCTNLVVGTTGSYQGSAGRVGTITFKVKATGTATVSVSGTSALSGSAISTGGGSGSYNLSTYVPPAQVPAAVNIASSSNPDQATWYSNSTVMLNWNKESNVTGFSYVLDQEDSTNPPNSVTTTGSSLELNLSQEGAWYFHIKAQSSAGWGPPAHFKINYDGTVPSFITSSIEYKGDLKCTLKFEAEDLLSGLDRYEISTDGGEFELATSPFTSQVLNLGQHSFTLKATDKAANPSVKDLDCNVDKIYPPEIIELSYQNLFVGTVSSRLFMRGNAPAGSTVIITINPGNIGDEVQADQAGNWEYTYDQSLADGEYTVEVTSEISGRKSEDSKEYSFKVEKETGLGNLPLTGSNSSSKVILVLIGMFLGGLIIGVLIAYFILRKKFKNKALNTTSPISPANVTPPSSIIAKNSNLNKQPVALS